VKQAFSFAEQKVGLPGTVNREFSFIAPERNMSKHQRLLVGLAVLAIGLAPSTIQAEKDKDSIQAKLVGKWITADEKAPQKVTLEFSKDGKIRVTLEAEFFTKGKDKEKTTGTSKEVMEGTYMVDGNKLTVALKRNDEERKGTMTIKTITDKMLITEEEGGRKEEYRRK
jgi:uncharacterized protein (TIGR03066 family)